MLKLTNKIDDYVTELQFDEVRKFRFAIPSLMLAIEFRRNYERKVKTYYKKLDIQRILKNIILQQSMTG
jgi:hypothetical protein